MLSRFIFLGLVSALFSISLSSQAAGVYLGAKTGNLDISVDELDNGSASGLQFGYAFDFGLAIQLEVLQGSADYKYSFVTGDSDIDTVAIYAVYRSQGTGYFMVKAGLLNEKVDIDTGYFIDEEESDTGFSTGIGGGVRLGEHFFIEAEYIIIEQDVNFIGISANLAF